MTDYLLQKYGFCLTLEELCNEFKISKQTLYNKLSRGNLDIPHFRVGRAIRFKSTDVAEAFH